MLPRKILSQFSTAYTLTAGGAVRVSANSPWLAQPTQGRRGELVGVDQAALQGQLLAVQWLIQAGDGPGDLGPIHCLLRTFTQGLTGDAERYNTPLDVTGDMLANGGIVEVGLVNDALTQFRLVLQNWSASDVAVFVRTTVTSSWTPAPARAEIQDANGTGKPPVERVWTVPLLDDDWQDDPIAGGAF